MGPVLRRARPESYVLDIGDNRQDARDGRPALVAVIHRPTVRTWREYQVQRFQLEAAHQVANPDKPAKLTLDEEHQVDGWLFARCVGPLYYGRPGDAPDAAWVQTGPLVLEDGEVVTDGAALWALQDELEREVASPLVSDILAALFDRATFDAGTLANLVSRSGSAGSAAPTDGIAETVSAGA